MDDGADELPEVMDFDFDASEWGFLLDDPAGRKSPPSSDNTDHGFLKIDDPAGRQSSPSSSPTQSEMEEELDVLRGCLSPGVMVDLTGCKSSSPEMEDEPNDPSDQLRDRSLPTDTPAPAPSSTPTSLPSEGSALSSPDQSQDDVNVDTMMDPHFPQNDVVDGDLALRIHWSQEAVALQALVLSTSTPAMRPDFSSAADEVDTISGERLEVIHQFIKANLSAVKAGACDLVLVVSGKESPRFSKSAESSPPGTVCIVVESLHSNRPFGHPNRDGTPNPVKWTKKKKGDRWERTLSWMKRKPGADDDLVYAPASACVHLRSCTRPASLACAGG